MRRLNFVIMGFFLTEMIGCSAQLSEAPNGQEASRAKQEEDRKPSLSPSFTYRPGAGLMIEGH